MLDGFYAGYMTADGYGVVLFVFKGSSIVGTDAGGVRFDGTYQQRDNSGSYVGKITIDAPPNVDLIQGINSGPKGLVYEVPFTLPENFLQAPFIKIDTPFGPVNVKLEKLRDLGGAA